MKTSETWSGGEREIKGQKKNPMLFKQLFKLPMPTVRSAPQRSVLKKKNIITDFVELITQPERI